MKNNILKTVLVFSITIPLLFIKCSKDPDDNLPKEPVPIDLNATQTYLVESGNSFAFDIFRKVVENADNSENIIISPLSISYALSMTLNGANGATREAMLEALRLNNITPEEINSSYQDLTDALLTVDKRVLMSIANSVWTENDFQVKNSFIDILANYYDAESRGFDINDVTAPDKINAWIEDKTNGLIKDMVEKLNDNTVMLLINAIYFKGKWQSQFDQTRTVHQSFYKPDGTEITVPMMKQQEDFKVYAGNGFLMGEFVYGQGNFVMDIILPDDQNGIPSLLPQVTDPAFKTWTNGLYKRELNLLMPRYKYGFKKQLKDILTDMGMGIAFTGGADFTNIAETPPLLINDVTHQAFIETNEEGTEAAAATVVEIGYTSMPPEPLTFNLDHAFLYIIRETTTNSIIFIGRVSDPLAE
ncbi:MAG: serpin family protein [Bacteroidales bacterium]|jgi:serpin B|nr:serpin family protein [Bacteroidales bacterium]